MRDADNPDVTQITLQTGVDEYKLHNSVLAVISSRLDGEERDMVRTGHAALDGYQMPDLVYFDVNNLSTLPPGKPYIFLTDEQLANEKRSLSRMVLRVYPKPSSDYNGTNVNMRVVRMPIKSLTTDDMNAVPEIPEVHHLEMLDWAAFLALRIVDLDAGNPGRANEFRAYFEKNVNRARRDAMRKLFAPLQWRFGGNGFSWDQGHGA